jgi:polysaccharide export outer membrane protein
MMRVAAARAWRIAGVCGILALAGCSALPTSGPGQAAVVDGFTPAQNPLGAHIVPLDGPVAARLRDVPDRSFNVIDGLRSNRPVDRLGPGDVLSISVYEAGQPLFAGRRAEDATGTEPSGSAATLPRMQVDRNGMIKVPYAGDVRVGGHTTTEVQQMIEAQLAGKTAQAQVVVTLVSNEANVVYVSGDVKSPGRFALTLERLNLLDVVAMAGGPTHSAQDTLVKVTRSGRTAQTSLRRVQTVTAENIQMDPLDRVQVEYLPRSYIALGATGRAAEVAFDAPRVTLAEAIARTGGLDDQRANPEAVFLFRYETADNAAAVLGGVPADRSTALGDDQATAVPIVYQINMRDPQTFFLMQRFDVHDKDIIYVANAPTVQIYKFLQLIYTLATPAITARAITN